MIRNDNNHTVLVSSKGTQMSNQNDKFQQSCKVCGNEKNLTRVAVRDDEEDLEDVPDRRIIWLCEGDYDAITKSQKYTLRELPDDIDIDHDLHEEVESSGESYVVILEEGNENKWLKVPSELETNLKDQR